MSMMGEQLAEEWLNRRGYFTIRGIKVGTGEIDLLAVRQVRKFVDCWHYEVQASLRPISYLCPASERKQGMSAFNARRRTREQLQRNVGEWIEKKYRDPRKAELRRQLWDGDWHFGLIIGNVRFREELDLIAEHGIQIVQIASILKEIQPKWSARGTSFIIAAAAGADLVDLMFAHSQLNQQTAKKTGQIGSEPENREK